MTKWGERRGAAQPMRTPPVQRGVPVGGSASRVLTEWRYQSEPECDCKPHVGGPGVSRTASLALIRTSPARPRDERREKARHQHPARLPPAPSRMFLAAGAAIRVLWPRPG